MKQTKDMQALKLPQSPNLAMAKEEKICLSTRESYIPIHSTLYAKDNPQANLHRKALLAFQQEAGGEKNKHFNQIHYLHIDFSLSS